MWEEDAGYFVFMVVRLRWDGFESMAWDSAVTATWTLKLARIET